MERDPGTGVTWSPEEDGGVHVEHNLPKIWGHAPSSFAIGSGNHRCLSHPGTWPPLFVATDNNSKSLGIISLRKEMRAGGDRGC